MVSSLLCLLQLLLLLVPCYCWSYYAYYITITIIDRLLHYCYCCSCLCYSYSIINSVIDFLFALRVLLLPRFVTSTVTIVLSSLSHTPDTKTFVMITKELFLPPSLVSSYRYDCLSDQLYFPRILCLSKNLSSKEK